ncbi:MAG: type II toxin-antitoxin system RelE/ParE family toxin [Actinobacteria bacterium]|nr:type II toxin-antitoxin system RelE/ParE family toxin [Actinomycetota bacterium]
MWDVEFTDEFEAWWDTLSVDDQQAIDAAMRVLEARGPSLGRPLVDTVAGSRHANMKELRVGTIRILFCFDPRRAAILLIGGDKRGRWQQFYARMIALADDLFDEHLAALEQQGPPGDP